MTILGSLQNIQSNIIGREFWPEDGFSRLFTQIDNDPPVAVLGSVFFRTVTQDSANGGVTFGTFTPVDVDDLNGTNTTFDAATKSNFQFAILIGAGEQGEAIDVETSDTADVMFLIQGPLILRKQYLVYTGTATVAATNNLQDLLEHLMDSVNVDDSFLPFDGTYGDVASITN